MNPLAFTALDLRALRPYARPALLSLAIAAVAIVLPSRSVYGVLTATFFFAATIGPQYPFNLDERSHLDTLYATLPLSRRSVVLGRYATMVAVALILAAASVLVTLAAAPFLGESPDAGTLGMLTLGGFAAFCLFTAVQLPFFFSLGFSRARPFAFIAPLVGLAALFFAFGGRSELTLTALDRLATWPVLASAAIGAVLLLGASAALSIRLYAARDL
ncbi:ABC-2 transporter permease [Xylanimonas ulmi]|uniref:ABC-2 family transporter n=1 Tax=Xylanimonas ulmi TaxID=228973 RepID=A0A4V2EXR0_9MICO|nr:ABC-2 transporter permease [Xylanibacterium ulmi]RZS60360.1 ABC-2 family transporter [Xylanibacterium ulmi]